MANDLRRLCFFGLACLIVSCASCAPSYSVPDHPEQIILYSIDGNDYDDLDQRPKTDETLHRYPVLGKVEITDPDDRKEIITALKAAGAGPMPLCFWPRHAVRVVEKGRTMDYLICFECRLIEWHYGGSSAAVILGQGTGKPFRAIPNARLKAAGVALARGAEK
jgi:hypothetical protein